MIGADLATLLAEGRERERAQTRFYRALAGAAEADGDHAAAERINGLLADEQHHLSRLTARLLELGTALVEPAPGEDPGVPWPEWEEEARRREEEEVRWYESALRSPDLDAETRNLLEEILASETMHRKELGGKWMNA